MTPLSTRMVEAAARAIAKACGYEWELLSNLGRAGYSDLARAALTAALALADAEGNALMPMLDPCETNTPVDGYNAGYNAHRAATLAGRAWP